MRRFGQIVSQTLSFLCQLVPWWFNKLFSRVLAFLWVDVLQIRKKVVYDNIEIAFPGTDLKTKKKWMRESIYILARNMFDLLKVPYLKESWIEKNVVLHGLENVKKYEQSGVLFLTLHMASADLSISIAHRKIKPLSVISKRFKSPFLDAFWFTLRTQFGAQFIDAHSGANAFDIFKALRKNRGVVFVLDQYMGPPYGVETQFFGRDTGTAYGLALFAQKTKLPVIPIYSHWGKDGKLNIVVKPEVDLSSVISDDTEKANVNLTNRFNKEVEAIITKHPEQWMWVHRRWKAYLT